MTSELYVSIDVETNGPCPGVNAMLSLGAAIIDPHRENPLVDSINVNFHPCDNTIADPATMGWWATQPVAWEALQHNRLSATQGMRKIRKFLDGYSSSVQKLIPVAYPAGFDFTFAYWYSYYHLREHIWGRACIDIRSYAMGVLDLPAYGQSNKSKYPKTWSNPNAPHTHVAVEDAIEQGLLFSKAYNHKKRTQPAVAPSPLSEKSSEQLIQEAIERLEALKGK